MAACWASPSGAPPGLGVVQPVSGTLAMSKTGSRCTSVTPASARARRWRMPALSLRAKAVYLPRSDAGTVVSPAEKSRRCSSYTTMSVAAATRAGTAEASQPAGLVAADCRLPIQLRLLLVDRLTEYGSVTRLRTTPTPRAKTSTP